LLFLILPVLKKTKKFLFTEALANSKFQIKRLPGTAEISLAVNSYSHLCPIKRTIL
jgi:hypothetical protein